MTIVINQQELKNALAIANKAIPSRPTHPILGNFLIKATENTVNISSFDLSTSISILLQTEVSESVNFTIPAKLFTDIINKLSDDTITIEIKESENVTINLVTKSGNFKILGNKAEEYPELPKVNAEKTFQISGERLKNGIKTTNFAASKDETKQILTGTNLKFQDNQVHFASTDGHRLATFSDTFEGNIDLDLTIPSIDLKELSNFIEGEVSVSIGNTLIEFKTLNFTFSSRVLIGSYPAYKTLIPSSFSGKIVINRNNFITAIELVTLLLSDKNHIVKLETKAELNQILLSADAKEIGKARQSLVAEITGDDIIIGFNSKYLLEGLKSINAEEIIINFNQPTQPVIIKPLNQIDSVYLLMPVQIRD